MTKRDSPEIVFTESDEHSPAFFDMTGNVICINLNKKLEVCYHPSENNIVGLLLHEMEHWAQFLFVNDRETMLNIGKKYTNNQDHILERANQYKSFSVFMGFYDEDCFRGMETMEISR